MQRIAPADSRWPRPIRLSLLLISLLAVAVQSNGQEVVLFHPAKVHITEGRFADSIETNIDYVLAHDPDRLLAPFRIAAGLEPKAPKYGNWESTGLDGHSAGHFISALSTLSLQSDNPLISERLDYMLDELALCQEANGNGYVGGVPNSKGFEQALREGKVDVERFSLNGAWVPWYNLHKTYAGLKDAWLFAGRQQAKDILVNLTDWTIDVTSNLSDEQMQKMLYAEHGGMNEVFAIMYRALGDKRYLDLAYRFTHHELLDPLIEEKDELTGFHANTQIPKVIGFEQTAIADNNDELHDASRYFWNEVVEKRSVSIGGNSVREHFHPADDFSSMIESREGPETCNTHNMMRLSDTLFQREPSSELVDYYERALFNHILSSQHPETGGLVYFTSMRPRHYRVYSVAENAFWCCVGSGIENSGRYSEFIYAHSNDTLFLNLFIPSKLDWSEIGLKLTQSTNFPNTPRTTITIDEAPKKKLKLKIRKPAWVGDTFAVSINGESTKAKLGSDGFVSISRKWKKGDTIEVQLPMQLRAEQLPDGSDFVSFSFGPIVLAANMGDEETPGIFAGSGRMEHIAPGPYLPLDTAPMLIGDIDDTLAHLEPVVGDPLHFHLKGDIRPTPQKSIVLEPFYRLHETRYSVYWQVVDEAEYQELQAELKKQESERLAIAARTVDSVSPGEQQSEVEHDYVGEGAYSNAHLGKRYRASPEKFSYSIRSGTNDPLELAVTIFGSEWGKSCQVKLNDVVVGNIELRSQYSDKFVEEVFDVPTDLTNEDRLTVTVEATNNQHTPMVFGISLRRKE